MDIMNDKEFNMFMVTLNETIDIMEGLIGKIKSLCQ